MLKENLKKWMPHVFAVVTFIVLAGIYFYPQLEGFQIRQSDTEQSLGMSREISDFRAKFGKEPLWTNAAFCGMPSYQISTLHANYVSPIEDKIILEPLQRPISYVVLAMIAFYILLICFDISPLLSIIGAVAYGFSSIFMLYIGAGHNSEVHAIALLPAVIGSLLLAYRKDYKLGAILLCFFLCLELSANHLQITYYSLFLIASIIIAELVIYIKAKLHLKFIQVSSVLLVAAIVGILPSFSNLYTTYEYGKYSTRGKSDLTISPSSNGTQKQSSENALDANYITQYSMGVGETWSVAIPDVKGGVETYIGNKKDIMADVNPDYRDYIAQQPSYWGEQDSSGGAFYFGATIFALFILGLIFIADPVKWAFLAASILAVVLSWKYGSILHYFIEHFPWFNKFRDTKMILILVQISFPFVGLLFIQEIFNRMIDRKKLLYAILAINGLLLLFYMLPTTFFDFVSIPESDNFQKQIASLSNKPEYLNRFNTFVSELENARIAIFKKDVLRSLLFSLSVCGLVYFFVIGKVKKNYFLGVLGVLVILDLWFVDKRILNNEEVGSGYKMWVQKEQYNNPYRASVADNFILSNELSHDPSLQKKVEEAVNQDMAISKVQDNEVQKERLMFSELGFATDYRVFTLQGPFSNGEVSYFHKSLGGYHGAKLKKYQELIDFYLTGESSILTNSLKDSTITLAKIAEILRDKCPVIDMLNTKYIIYNQGAAPFVNQSANGNCWLVKDVKYAENADDEMMSLGKVNLKATAVINRHYQNEIVPFKYDSTATINLISCLPNHLVYKSKSGSPQLAVFSEIYYPKGWNAYIDGKKSDYFSADYLLRSMSLPAGEHTVEFRFEPKSYAIGELISKYSSFLLIFLLLGALSYELYLKMKVKPASNITI